VTAIVWSLYVWLGAIPSYDIEHRPVLEQTTKLVGDYETQARCIPRKIERTPGSELHFQSLAAVDLYDSTESG
jgi:hypothetical protein